MHVTFDFHACLFDVKREPTKQERLKRYQVSHMKECKPTVTNELAAVMIERAHEVVADIFAILGLLS